MNMNPEALVELLVRFYPELESCATLENAENFLDSDPMVSDASVDEFANYLYELYFLI